MTQVYNDEKVVPVTIVEIPENTVCSVTPSDGESPRSAVEIGVGAKRRPNSAEKGRYTDVKTVPSHVWTVWTAEQEVKSGVTYGAEIAGVGDTAVISGISKGKGFAGVVKRWGFHGGPKTHGQSDRHRAPGSIGAGTDPGRVWKGTKMAGKMGGVRNTLYRRKIVGVGDGYVLVKGALPGNAGGVLRITLMKK